MPDEIVYGTSSVKLEGLSGAESELKFFSAQMPSATATRPEAMASSMVAASLSGKTWVTGAAASSPRT